MPLIHKIFIKTDKNYTKKTLILQRSRSTTLIISLTINFIDVRIISPYIITMISQLYIFRSIYLVPLIVGVSLNIGCLTQADNDLKSEVENKTDNTYYRNGDFFTSTVSAHKSAPIKYVLIK